MNKVQFEKEITTRTEMLKSYKGQVQKINNYRYDIECQSYFPMVDGIIRKMNRMLTNCLSLSDAEFKNLNFEMIMTDLNRLMEEPSATLEHIKSKGPLPGPTHQIY